MSKEKDTTINPYEMLAKANQDLLDKGVPKEAVAEMSAIAVGRMRWMKLKAKIAREMFPIQQMPEPPGIFYHDWPVTEVIDDDEEE
jgi:hypothetical protein